MTQQPEDSPLTEASPDSLDELFARYDHAIAQRTLATPEAQRDLEAIVAALRKQREAWLLAEASGKPVRTKKALTKAQATSLADLGLD
jgi:hypothetical protein